MPERKIYGGSHKGRQATLKLFVKAMESHAVVAGSKASEQHDVVSLLNIKGTFPQVPYKL